MTWSLLNAVRANDVAKLLDEGSPSFGPDEPRGMKRETALAIIHAVIWAHGSRAGSTAAGYAMMNLMLDALRLKDWTFSDDESTCLQQFRRARHYPKMTEADISL